MPIKHHTQSSRVDNDDAGDIQPSHWNADHDITGMLAKVDSIAPTPNTLFSLDGAGNPVLIPVGSLPGFNSPAFTGTPTVPTAPLGTNTLQIANMAALQAAIAHLINAAPGALDTLNELAAALGNDPNFATTITNALALKAPLASPAFSGAPTAPTVAGSTDSTTTIATTAFVQAVAALLAPKASPALTGTPTTPTVAGSTDSTTKIASTAFVQAVAALLAPLASPAFSGTPTAPTPAAGTNSTAIATMAALQTAITGSTGAFGQCKLALSGGNIVLSPVRGNLLTINGAPCTIPDAGVSLPPTGLTVGTLYYIYATQSGGVVNALEASTTGHSTDTAAGNHGVEIKTGAPTRTLVGMVRPITGPAFSDTMQKRFVRSWFNRKPTRVFPPRCSSAATLTGVVSEIESPNTRGEFLIWADEGMHSRVVGMLYGSNTAALVTLQLWLDGGTVGNETQWQVTGNGVSVGEVSDEREALSEGYHYIAPAGGVSNTTGTTPAGLYLSYVNATIA